MSKGYTLLEPPEHTAVDSWAFKRWFDEVQEMIMSKITIVTVTTTYTVKAIVYYIRADATAGIFTITLPAAVSNQGRSILIKKIDATANAVTISRAGTDTIEGSTTASLATQWTRIHLISNGVDTWEIV